MTELYILTSFYLAEYDVDYTANHHQSIEDVPGVPDIALNMAPYTPSRRGGGRQERREMQGSITGIRGMKGKVKGIKKSEGT